MAFLLLILPSSAYAAALSTDGATRVQALLNKTGGSCTRVCTASDKLHWWGARIGDAGCATLAERILANPNWTLSNLLLGTNDLTDGCVQSLSNVASQGRFKKLRALGLSRNGITDAGCETLAKSFASGAWPQLRDLYLSSNPELGDRCVNALARALAAKSALERVGFNDLPKLTSAGVVTALEALRARKDGFDGTLWLREFSLKDNAQLCKAGDTTTRLREVVSKLGSIVRGLRCSRKS